MSRFVSRSLLLRLCAVLFVFALLAAACGSDDDTEAVDTADGVADTADGGADTADAGADTGAADTAAPAIEAETSTPEPLATPLAPGGECVETVAVVDPPAEGTDAATDTATDAAPEVDIAEADPTDLSLKPLVELPATAPTELVTGDIVAGEGDTVASGDFVIMEYVGVSCSTGAEFDSSWDRGQPFSVVLGQGDVIAGWDEGIVGMAVGGRRLLIIPPDLAYGDTGSGSGSIVPGETIAFVVDLRGFVPGDLELPEPTVPDAPATELTVTDLTEGTGVEATPDSVVWVHYRGVTQSDGAEFDNSLERGIDQPLVPQLSEGQLIDGMIEGITGMKVGGVREIVIPADLAYGETGAGDGVIGPDETLVFTVSLHGVYEVPAIG